MELFEGLTSGFEFVRSAVMSPRTHGEALANNRAKEERAREVRTLTTFGRLALRDYEADNPDYESAAREIRHSILYPNPKIKPPIILEELDLTEVQLSKLYELTDLKLPTPSDHVSV